MMILLRLVHIVGPGTMFHLTRHVCSTRRLRQADRFGPRPVTCSRPWTYRVWLWPGWYGLFAHANSAVERLARKHRPSRQGNERGLPKEKKKKQRRRKSMCYTRLCHQKEHARMNTHTHITFPSHGRVHFHPIGVQVPGPEISTAGNAIMHPEIGSEQKSIRSRKRVVARLSSHRTCTCHLVCTLAERMMIHASWPRSYRTVWLFRLLSALVQGR
jgi:hypothetical protein